LSQHELPWDNSFSQILGRGLSTEEKTLWDRAKTERAKRAAQAKKTARANKKSITRSESNRKRTRKRERKAVQKAAVQREDSANTEHVFNN
jgi:hypothetical protein